MSRHIPFALALAGTLVLSACGSGGTSTLSATTSTSPPSQTVVAPTVTPALPTPIPATPTPAVLSWQTIYDRLSPSVVMIRADLPPTALSVAGEGSGTGIVFSDDGYIVTNAHVVEGASALTVSLSGSSQQRHAQLVGVSGCDDLAVIKVDNTDGLKAAQLGSSKSVQVGQEVAALGFPLGDATGNSMALTHGGINKLDVSLGQYDSLLQTDATLNPGNSGGPLVNQLGQVIGINTLAANRDVAANTYFAISLDPAKAVIQELEQKHNHLWLGMNLKPNNYAKVFGTQAGVVVVGTDNGSPASHIGVQPADLLTKLAGSDVNTVGDVCKILRSHGDGDVLKTQFLRLTADPKGNVTGRQLWEGDVAVGKPDGGAALLQLQSASNASTTSSAVAVASSAVAVASSDSTITKTYDFQSDTGVWYTGDDQNKTVTISEGVYKVAWKAPGHSTALLPRDVPATKDQGIASVVGVHSGYAGLVLRYTTNNGKQTYYTCVVDNASGFYCSAVVDGQVTSLARGTNPAITAGKANKLVFLVNGNKLTFEVNNVAVLSTADSKIASGQLGLTSEGVSQADLAAGKAKDSGLAAFGSVQVVVAP